MFPSSGFRPQVIIRQQGYFLSYMWFVIVYGLFVARKPFKIDSVDLSFHKPISHSDSYLIHRRLSICKCKSVDDHLILTMDLC